MTFLEKKNVASNKFRILSQGMGALYKAYSTWNVGVITDSKVLEQAQRLRGFVFGEKLKWIDADSQSGDIDAYDQFAIHFGVLEKNDVIAYGRLIPGEEQFMIEHDFSPLVEGIRIRKGCDSAEISRLVISDDFRGTLAGEVLQAFLYRAMYRWALNNGMRYWYIVVTPGYFRKLQRYFNFCQIGLPFCFDASGQPAIAGFVDLRDAEERVRKNNILISIWYCGIKVVGPFFGSRMKNSEPLET